MNNLKQKLLTGVAALALIAGPTLATAQSADTDADVNATVGSETGADVDSSVETDTDAMGTSTDTDVDADAEMNEDGMSADTDAGTSATTEEGGMSADTDASTSTSTEDESTMSAETDAETDMETDAVANWGALADAEVGTLIGTSVYSAEGNDVGEVDNFAEVNGEVSAIIGIGGFLGIAEHNVAIAVEDLTLSGEDELMVQNYTEEELKALPEYDEANAVMLDGATSLRAATGS